MTEKCFLKNKLKTQLINEIGCFAPIVCDLFAIRNIRWQHLGGDDKSSVP